MSLILPAYFFLVGLTIVGLTMWCLYENGDDI